MNNNADPFVIAKKHADEFETILDVTDLTGHIDALNSKMPEAEHRDLGLGDVVGAASLLVGLIALFIQIREGNTFQGESDKVIAERLILKLSAETDLPPRTRERLIQKLIELNFDNPE